jgi:hypothetical protein
MTIQQWREAMATRPFIPFRVRTASRELEVKSPEMAFATPGGRVVFICTSEDSAAAVDLLLVESIEPMTVPLGPPGERPLEGAPT